MVAQSYNPGLQKDEAGSLIFEFKASLGYTVSLRFCLKAKTKQKPTIAQ